MITSGTSRKAITKQGISGVARLRNEEEFLPIVIERFLPFLDEIILVYDKGNTDNTPDMCHEYAKMYPDVVKAYSYPHATFPQGSIEKRNNNVEHPAQLHNYYNWAFAKATRMYSMKIDGDLVPRSDAELLKPIMLEYLEKYKMIHVFGANLSDNGEDFKIFTYPPREHMLSFVGYQDHLVRLNDRSNFFYDRKHYEQWFIPLRNRVKFVPFMFFYYHLRWLKEDVATNWGNISDPSIYFNPILKSFKQGKGIVDFDTFIKYYEEDCFKVFRSDDGKKIRKMLGLTTEIDLGSNIRIPNPNNDERLLSYFRDVKSRRG